jgi:opacity protein-like surface antigen
MAIVTKTASTMALLVFMVLLPALASAQDERFRASFTPAVATVSGDAELALAGSFGYRFSERFWFEGDLTWIDAAAGGFRDRTFLLDADEISVTSLAELLSRRSGLFGSGRSGGRFGLPSFPTFPDVIGQYAATTDGTTLIATLGIRYELPVQTERFRPYLAGGLGIANTDQEFDIERLVFDEDIDNSLSDTGFAFSAGAGASVRLISSLWADVDAKYFRLSRERNVMRLGGGVSFRF